MFQHRELGLNQSYQFAASVVLTLVYWGWYVVLEALIPGFRLTGITNYFEYYLALILGFQVSFLNRRQQDIFSITSGILESHRIVRPHILVAVAITALFLVLTKDDAVSRTFLFTFIPMAWVLLVLFTRYLAFPILYKLQKRADQKLVLVGKPEELAKVESLLSKARFFGMVPVGIVTEAAEGDLPEGYVKLGGPGEMERVLGQHKSANIFLLGSPRDRRVLGEWMRLAEHNGSRVSMVNDLDVFLQRPLSYFRCDDVDLIELREEPLQNPVNRLVKRGVDLLISFPVVVIVLPVLMGVVWILHRWQAPGPLIFRQVRSGIDNEPFTILKFRTMYDGKGGDGGQARKHDDRVFPAGRWLRRFSLDEFPQFFNVLTGQMSVVGPRPHMVGHDEVFAESMSGYAVRGFVKPGITGLAQIRGLRGETVTPEDIVNRVQSDIEYIENWSVMLDVRILWQTSLQLVRPPKSAY